MIGTIRLSIFFLCIFCIPHTSYSAYKRYIQKKSQQEYAPPMHDLDLQNLYTNIIENKIDIYRGGNWYSPLIQALDTHKRDVALYLLYFGANPRCIYKGITPLRWAIDHDDYELVYHLLKSNAPFGTAEIKYAKQASQNKDIPALLSYVLDCRRKGKRRLARRDKYGLAPIHYAAYQANKPQFDALILSDISANMLDAQNKTPLYYAQYSNNASFTKYIIKQHDSRESPKITT